MNLKLRVGESLDNELTAMFTLNLSEIRPFFKGQGYHSNLDIKISTFQDPKYALLCNNSDRF